MGDIFDGRGAPLTSYAKREADWPKVWVLPDLDDDAADLFAKFAHLADDVLLRTAVNIWDNGLRLPGAFEGILAGLMGAHVRLCVGHGVRAEADLEEVADSIREAWLAMARLTIATAAEEQGA